MSQPLTPPPGVVEKFIGDLHSGDWVQAGLLFVAILALLYTARTLKEETRSRDFENYFALMERFATAWRRFGDANDDMRVFEFNELMNLFEATCHLYVKNVVRGATREMIRDYLREMLPDIFGDERAKQMIDDALSDAGTFIHIRMFARLETLNGVPQH